MLYTQVLRRGDTLRVTRLDRLGRSVLHVVTRGAKVREHGVELILASTRGGLAAARAHGRARGRRPKFSGIQAALAQRLYAAGDKTVQQIAGLFGAPRSTVYGYLTRTADGTPV